MNEKQREQAEAKLYDRVHTALYIAWSAASNMAMECDTNLNGVTVPEMAKLVYADLKALDERGEG